MKKTVLFGGTFNPLHFGHVKLIEEVISALRPDRFILIPAHLPPHKVGKVLAADEDRLEMCRLGVSQIPLVEVCDYEIASGGESYTVRTLEYIHSLYPDDELYVAMGSDKIAPFLDWYMTDRIMELATIVCILRDKADRKAIEFAKAAIEARGGRCVLLDCEPLICSATDIRSRISIGEPIGDIVPEHVAEYIRRKGLYRDGFKN